MSLEETKTVVISEATVKATISTIANLVRSVHLKRALHAVDDDPDLNFWRVIYGNLTDIAVLEWCKLFGSDHSDHQPVHWKNMISVCEHPDFRRRLWERLHVSENDFKAYRTTLKDYRDTRVAHMDFKRPSPKDYPEFDLALESAYFYYDEILPTWWNFGRNDYPEDIRKYCAQFANLSGEVASVALGATSAIKERVL
jgi:hypothetical protein